jgi:hypothetical protein
MSESQHESEHESETETLDAVPAAPKAHWLTPDVARKLRFVAVALVMASVVMFGLYGFEWRKSQRLRTEGVLVSADVMNPDSLLDVARGKHKYTVWVTYLPEGKTDLKKEGVQKRLLVDEDIYERAISEHVLPVRYLRDEPIFADVEGEIAAPSGAAVAGGTFLMGALALWGYVAYRRRLSATQTPAR